MSLFLQVFYSIIALCLTMGEVSVPITGELTVERKLEMVYQGVNLIKSKEYEAFMKDERSITSLKSILLFHRVWNKLSKNDTRKLIFPSQIVWLNGAPGAGKGTNERHIMRLLEISKRPIVMSDLLKDEKFKQKINQGLLIDDEDVIFLLLQQIISDGNSNGIIVDGYPRTKIQAECIQLLQSKFEKISPIKMLSIVLILDEETSVKRQHMRAEEAIERNRKVMETGKGDLIPIRATDKSGEIARKRYITFCEQTMDAVKLLRKFTRHHEINASDSIDEVRARITDALREERSPLGSIVSSNP